MGRLSFAASFKLFHATWLNWTGQNFPQIKKAVFFFFFPLLPLTHTLLDLENFGLCKAHVRWLPRKEQSLWETPELLGNSFMGALQGSNKLCSWWASWLLLLVLKPWECRGEYQRKRPPTQCLTHEKAGQSAKGRWESLSREIVSMSGHWINLRSGVNIQCIFCL